MVWLTPYCTHEGRVDVARLHALLDAPFEEVVYLLRYEQTAQTRRAAYHEFKATPPEG